MFALSRVYSEPQSREPPQSASLQYSQCPKKQGTKKETATRQQKLFSNLSVPKEEGSRASLAKIVQIKATNSKKKISIKILKKRQESLDENTDSIKNLDKKANTFSSGNSKGRTKRQTSLPG